jgi:cytochrome c oxidase subunit 3
MNERVTDQNRKIHPHKFTMWVAIGSILMMFAGLTSAYIVKRSQVNWLMIEIPTIFWFSTFIFLRTPIESNLCHALKRSLQHLRQVTKKP